MRSCELACFAASVSMSRPVSRSWFCQACRKRLAAARAELYPRSGTARDDECLLRASADVDSIGARERMTSGKARCLPDRRRACPEVGRRDAGATSSEFTTRLCGKLPDAPRDHRGSLRVGMNIVIPSGAQRALWRDLLFSQLHLRRLLRFLDNATEWRTGVLARQAPTRARAPAPH